MNDTKWRPATGFGAWWERVGAGLYDPFLAMGERLGMRARRREVLGQARGRVLEIGAGTGLNVEHYPDGLDGIVLTEPVAPMAARLRHRARRRPEIEVVEASADDLPFPDASFDTVVSTMVLCTVPDAEAAMREMARVLAPGGKVLFIEHVHSTGTRLGRWQSRLAGPWSAFAQGCRCDRDLVGSLREHFDLAGLRSGTWRGMPAIVKPLVTGAAIAA